MGTRKAAALVIGVAAAGAWGQCEEVWDDRFGWGAAGFPLCSVAAAGTEGAPVVFALGYRSQHGGGGAVAWDGTAWSRDARGLDTDSPSRSWLRSDPRTGIVYALGPELRVDGEFLGWFLRWDGSAWTDLGRRWDFTHLALGLVEDQERVAVVTWPKQDGSSVISLLENEAWVDIGSIPEGRSASGAVWADIGMGEQLLVFGSFEEIAGEQIANVAAWSGGGWEPIGGGVDMQVSEAVEYDLGRGSGVLLMGDDAWRFLDGAGWLVGSYDNWPAERSFMGRYELGGEDVLVFQAWTPNGPPFRLWTWDGAAWRVLPGEFDGRILDSCVYRLDGEPTLLAAGEFSTIDGKPRSGAAVLDGRGWSSVGETNPGGSISGADVLLHVGDEGGPLLGNRLYASGDLATNSQDFSRIAAWDGVRWELLGLATSGHTEWRAPIALADLGEGPRLVVGGTFWGEGGQSGHVLQWDGQEWSSVGTPWQLQGEPRALVTFDDGDGPRLYACGWFSLGGSAHASIARFNGDEWEMVLDSSVGGVIDLETVDDGSGPILYACGSSFDLGNGPVGPVIKQAPGGWEQAGNALYWGDEIGTTNFLSKIEIDGKRMLTVQGIFELDLDWYPNTQNAVLDDGVWKKDLDYLPHHAWVIDSVETPGGLVTMINTFGGSSDTDHVDIYEHGAWRTVPGEIDGGINVMTLSDVGGAPALYVSGWFTHIDDLPSNDFARFGCPPCPADFDADGDADEADVVAYLDLWTIGDVAADVNRDGYIDTRDVLAFFNAWGAGC